MLAKLSPGSRAASRRQLAQSSGVRTAWASWCRRSRSAASLRWRSSSRSCLWPGEAASCPLAVWSSMAGFEAAGGRQPPEPVVGDAVSLAAQLLGEGCLAQPAAVLRGLGEDAGSGCDKLAVTVRVFAGDRVRRGWWLACPGRRRSWHAGRQRGSVLAWPVRDDGRGSRGVAVEPSCGRLARLPGLSGTVWLRGPGRGPGVRSRYRRAGRVVGDQVADGCAGGVGGGVVEPGQGRGQGEYLDLAQYLGGDFRVSESGAGQGSVRTALGAADLPPLCQTCMRQQGRMRSL